MVFMIGVNYLIHSKEVDYYDCEDWEFISHLLIDKNSYSCYFKWHSLLKSQALGSSWSKKEDDFILNYYE